MTPTPPAPARDEIKELQAWKQSAIAMLREWHALGEALLKFAPAPLGTNIPEHLRAAIPELLQRHGCGPRDDTPYVPSWSYPVAPKVCPCGHHEGFHDDAGICLLKNECGCAGLPADCKTLLDE